jgi:hypothetical protein
MSIEKHSWTNVVYDQRLAGFLSMLTLCEMEFLVQDSPNKDWTPKVYLEVLCSKARLTSFEIYCKDSATMFHHFFLTILVGYARALLRLKMVVADSRDTALKHWRLNKKGGPKDGPAGGLDEEVSYQVGVVAIFADVLTSIVYSHALKEHLQALPQHMMWPPMICYKDDYMK